MKPLLMLNSMQMMKLLSDIVSNKRNVKKGGVNENLESNLRLKVMMENNNVF